MLAEINALKAVDNATQDELDAAVETLVSAINKKANQTTVDDIEGRVEDLENAGYATTEEVTAAKNEAINTAANDATSKADAALAAAKAYADENDADTTYTAGTGLVLNGTIFSIDPDLTLVLDANA